MKMLCRALLAAIAVTYLICVLVLSGMQKEDLDVSLLRKLQRHNINADDINSDKVRKECQLNSSHELSITNTRINNDNSSLNHITTSTANTNMDHSSKTDVNNYDRTTETARTKDLLRGKFNETKDKGYYEVESTKDHNIKTRSSINDVNSTQATKFSEAMTFFGDQKNLDNVMNMLQTYLKAKLVENNNTKVLKSSTSTQITSIPPTKPTEMTTESKSKDSDMIKVLATFVFNKPIPVEPHYKLDDEKNSLVSKLLDNIKAKSATTDNPDESYNDTRTTELFSDQDYLSYKSETAYITPSVDDEYKPLVQSNLDHMMNEFRIQSKIKSQHTLEYENNDSTFANSQTENLYVPDLRNIIQNQPTRQYNQQSQFDDYKYSKLVDIIKSNTSDTNMKNQVDKSLHPDIIKEIADKVKEIVLRDLKKEVLPSVETTRSTVTTTQKITTKIPQKLEKNNIQQATHALQTFVKLLEQLKSAKEFIMSPVKDGSSKEANKNSEFHVDAKEKDSQNQMESAPTVNQNNCDKINGYMPNVATVNGYKIPEYDLPIQYHQQYKIVSYVNTPDKMVPPLMNNPYGVQQPGGRAIINVPQGIPPNNKQNTINIITPVNHTPVININQMRPAPIMIQTSKEIPPLGIPVAMPTSLNRNIVMPMLPPLMTLNETERQRWAYIMKYGRNPDKRSELNDLRDKLTQYTNFKSTPTKQGSDKKTESSISNFCLANKRDKLPECNKFGLPIINVREQDKRSDTTVLGSSLLNTRDPDRINDPKMFNSPAVTKQDNQRLTDFKNYNLPNLNVREADRTSRAKTLNSLDNQEQERMIDPTLSTGDQAKYTPMKKLNTIYKQQQVYDEAVLADIKTKLLYKDRHKTYDGYRGLTNRQPLTSHLPDMPNHDYYDRPNVYNPHFLEASVNYPNTDTYIKRDYNYFSKRGPYREYIDISKPNDLYIPKKDLLPNQIHDIKGFHEKLERGDYYERRDPVNVNVNGLYETSNMPRQYDENTINHDANDYSKTQVESRQQLPLTGGTRMSKFDDTHFNNFLKTQQKVNDMLERILATKTNHDYPPSVETT